MRVNRFLSLAEQGYNVPRFIRNPVTNYGRDAYLCMKDYFQFLCPFDVLVTRKDGKDTKLYESIHLGDAILRLSHLEASNYDAVLFETVKVEWDVTLLLYGGESGKLCVFYPNGKNDCIVRFSFLGEIPDLIHRHVVRTCLRLLKEHPGCSLCVDACWAKTFTGVNFSRLVITDFSFL